MIDNQLYLSLLTQSISAWTQIYSDWNANMKSLFDRWTQIWTSYVSAITTGMIDQYKESVTRYKNIGVH